MPRRDGSYTKADIAKKLGQAQSRLAKGDLQESVWALFDALQMIATSIEGAPKMNWTVPDVSKVRLGSGQDANAGVGFRQATVAERIQLATLKMGGGHWLAACRNIRESAAMIQRIADSKNKRVMMTNTPASHARHVVGKVG